MICPKCLTIETDGSLRCRRCGAQLYTGVFPAAVPPVEKPSTKGLKGSTRTNLVVAAVLLVAVLVLVVVLSRLETVLQ